MRLIELAHFRAERGHCWTVVLPDGLAVGDTSKRGGQSGLHLFEDDTELGPGHALHDHIRSNGMGAYSHWGHQLYLSTSDNSNPNTNRRLYRIAAPTAPEAPNALRRAPDSEGVPCNYAPLERHPERIRADAEYAIAVARSYAEILPRGVGDLRGRSVLELGPGHHFGASLILKCWGAGRITVADRFLVKFDAGYHVALYREICQWLLTRDAGIDLSPLATCIESAEHHPAVVEAVNAPLEELAAEFPEAFDITLSNAVLEHLFDPAAALSALCRVTASNGQGFHQVDFRDHRDFSRPLEYLLLDEWSFARLFRARYGDLGNRARPHEMTMMLRAGGFRTVHFEPNTFAAETYVREFLPRLRTSELSPYRNAEEKTLIPIGGRFRLAK